MIVNTILVPTDYSSSSDEVLGTAVELAKMFKARIVLLHSYHAEIPMVSAVEGPFTLPPGFYDELKAASSAHIEEIAADLTRREGVEAVGIALSDPAAFAIIGQAESLPAELIVMATRGLTGIKHVMLGSVAERVVRTAPCPVLTVNPSR